MSNEINVEVMNLEQVIRATRDLQDLGKQKALSKGLGKGGRYLMQKSKARLRKGMQSPQGKTGNLLASYRVKIKHGNTGFLMGFDNKGHHAHLVDLGHELVVGKKRIHTGKRTKALMFQTDTRQDVPQAARIASQGIVEMIDQYR